MEITAAKKLIDKYVLGHSNMVQESLTAERYYRNDNDIMYQVSETKEDSPLRNADNRISHNFHGLLVNQKAAYMFTAPPLFDVGKQSSNNTISEVLGDGYAKACKDLCVNASNSGVAWLHYWIDDAGDFQYAVVDSKQIIPLFTDDLSRELSAVLRVYRKVEDAGNTYEIYEIWTETECSAYKRQLSSDQLHSLQQCYMFSVTMTTGETEDTNIFMHDFGRVPFIPFFNNNIKQSDLKNVKGLIDIYDRVYCGFVNDLEDIQEVIFILSGYGGTNLQEFMQDMKEYKAIKLDADSEGTPGVSTLSVQIPVEARKELLKATRKDIFEQGQGVDPSPEGGYGNASGEALKFMYAMLEQKAGLCETEFKLGFGKLVEAICGFKNIQYKKLIQTWTRTSIKNETELANIVNQSVGVVSTKTILKNHPLVEDADMEEKYLAKESEEKQAKQDELFGFQRTQEQNDEEEDQEQ